MHIKVLEKGVPDDVMVGIKNTKVKYLSIFFRFKCSNTFIFVRTYSGNEVKPSCNSKYRNDGLFLSGIANDVREHEIFYKLKVFKHPTKSVDFIRESKF